jgi:transcriptional regulator with XRE-family HTH domain
MNPRVTALDRQIAARLKALRKGRGNAVTLEKIAQYLDMTYQSYQRMERGEVSFRASTLKQLAIFYSVPVSYFFDGDFDGESPTAMDNQGPITYVVAAMRKVPAPMAQDIMSWVTWRVRQPR